jgi:hypothetical protein
MAIAKYLKTCGKNVPGNRATVYLTELANVTSVAETSNKISTVTMAGGATMKRVQAEIDTVQFTSEGNFSTAGGETQNLILGFGNRSTDLELLRAELIAGVACGLVAVWVDNNGKCWLGGVSIAAKEGKERPFNRLASNFDSGLVMTDEDTAKYTITLTRTSGYAPVEFDATLTTAILGGTATFIDWA